ncbi:hypothetical protein DYB35_001406 [Aphanomyces astaci]|uniref:Protein kinase domain-containing protein n=1 Tax=Aphanomyces astaci TaxID=112090 RepID=A0A3R7AKB3_APHAT|nr:hypothetical protein DYB35_001406 [Aphanomyces astaci]
MASTKAVVATLTTKCANKTSVACVVNGTTEVDVPLSSSSSSFYVPNGVEYIEYFPSQPTTMSVSTNEMTTFDTVTLPESLQSINLDINDYDVFNVDAPTFIVLKNASVYTDRIIRPTAACTGTKQTFNGTPFPPSKFSKPTSALLHTACVVAPVAATTGSVYRPRPSFQSTRGQVITLSQDPRYPNLPNYNQDASTFAYRYDIRGDADLINFRIPKRELQNRSVCGSGGFATVYRATFHDQVVAVKELTASMHAQHRHIQAFMHEIKLHATLNHGNIVRFIGASWTTLNDLAVVSEFMSEGDLRDFLARDAVPQHLPWFQPSTQQEGRGQFCTKLSLAVNLADAVTYLHSFDPPILHRDLKSRNVLLSDTFTAKLTDFGISRELADDTMTTEAGTAAWTAPEVLTNNGHYNEKADMYSFGVVLSELDTWQIPYSSTSSQSSNGPNGYSNVQMAMLVAAGKLAPSFRSDCPPEVLALARACLGMDPDSRPTASIVAYELRRLQSAKVRQ